MRISGLLYLVLALLALLVGLALAATLTYAAPATVPPSGPAWDAISTVLRALMGHPTVQTLAAWILVDVVLGMLAAREAGDFELRRLGDFMGNMVLPYLVGLCTFRLAALAVPEFEAVANVVWVLLMLAIYGSVKANWQRAFPGAGEIPLPSVPTPHG